MNIQPVNNYLLVKPIERQSALKSGILIPETSELDSEAQISWCEVLDSCPGSGYSKGDTVLFSKLVPDDVQFQGEDGKMQKLWFVKESDIKGVIKK